MPRNPKIVALERGRRAQRNYVAADAARRMALAARKRAMMACLDAGCSLRETGTVFAASGSYVSNVRAELAAELAATTTTP